MRSACVLIGGRAILGVNREQIDPHDIGSLTPVTE